MKHPLFYSNNLEKQFHPITDIESKNTELEDLVSLYVIRKDDGICLYSHHFNLGHISRIENQLVGMGFVAIITMIKEVVDSNSQLLSINLAKKSILIESQEGILFILVVKRTSLQTKIRLKEFAKYFHFLFELQQQINKRSNLVCKEDYALTSDLINLIFSNSSSSPLELIPLIFKEIQKIPSEYFKIEEQFSKLKTKTVSTENK